MKLGILDIETTGLNPERNHFVLGGLATASDNEIMISQFFSGSLADEQRTLAAFLTEVEKVDLLLTYNGKHFDLPFIRQRASDCPSLPYNLDLYLLLNNYSSLRKFLPNLKQKTVEDFMGLWCNRTDEISGRESVLLYHEFLQTGNVAAKEKILLHNADDVLQLYRLLKVLEKCDLHRAMYHMGFPISVGAGKTVLHVKRIKTAKNTLVITGDQSGAAIDYRAFEPYQVTFDKSAKTFMLCAPLLRYANLVLIDLKSVNMDPSPFEKYPAYGESLLIIERNGEQNYRETNHFIKELIARKFDQWITKR
jgi:DNA polymerase III epsilon subunit-like protein